MTDPSIPLAFAAGVVSFLSPCVLPLVPGYLSYMSGVSGIEGPAESNARRSARTAVVALAFVAGFSLVFVSLGATATLLGSTLREHQRGLAQAGGVLIILFGLIFMGAIKVPFLYREKRWHPSPGAGVGGSVVLGAAFAFGWSPCIGATLGAVLTMAAGGASTGGVGEGAFLLFVYSLGLGIPFVLAGLGVGRLTGALTWLRRHTRTVNLVSGILLVAVGLLLVTDQFFRLSIWFQKTFPSSI